MRPILHVAFSPLLISLAAIQLFILSRYAPSFFPPAESLTSALQVLPLAAARYNDFTKDDTPFGVLVLADGFYLSSGFFNVVLYWYTRPYLLPNRVPEDSLDDQSFVLRSESPDGQIHPPSFGNNRHASASFMEHKSDDPAYESSEIALFAQQDGPLTASLRHDHKTSRDEVTRGYTTNRDDDI